MTMDLKQILIVIAVLIALFFVLFSKISINDNQYTYKGFFYDWLFCGNGQCYSVQADSQINATTYEPVCSINNSLECCTDINNYTTCRNSTGISEFPEGDY